MGVVREAGRGRENEGRGAGEGRKAKLSLMSWGLLRFPVLKPFSIQGNIFTAGKLQLKLHLLPKAIDGVMCNLWVTRRARENGKTRLKAAEQPKAILKRLSGMADTRLIYNSKT